MRHLLTTLALAALLLTMVAAPAFAQTTPSVTALDQASDGTMVMVDEVVSDGPGFIVIHASKEDGTVGPVVGKAAVVDGSNSDIMVTLDESVADGAKLWAMLHKDDNTLGSYEFGSVEGADAPVTLNGEIVMQPFMVTVAAATTTSAPQTMPTAGSSNSSLPLIAIATGLALIGTAHTLRPRQR